MTEILDINDERIAFYKSLRFTPKLHTDNRAFIAEEEKVVVALLQSNIEIISIFGTMEFVEKHNELIAARHLEESSIFYADIDLMKQIVGYKLHSGFLAMGKQPQNVPISNLSTPIIILNAINNAENVGSIVRNAAAFGYKSIIYDEASVSPYLRRAVRVSMGNIFNIDVHHSQSIIDAIYDLINRDMEIIGVEITHNSLPISDFKPKDKNYCLIFGSESKGIDTNVLDKCHYVVHIPMAEKVPSLNVASSSSVVLNQYSNL